MKIEYEEEGEYPTRVKAGFDRSCVFTNKGNCYIWGGEDLSALGGENYQGIGNVKKELGFDNSDILDVGFGYMHTILLLSQRK